MAENQSCGFSDYNFDHQVKLRHAPLINACLLAGLRFDMQSICYACILK